MEMNGRLTDDFVARVRSESDIVSVVSGYVALKKKGNRYWGCCPFHHEKTPSFSVVPDQGFFYCFGCHAGGNVFKFISLIENISYYEAIRFQAERLNIPLPEREKSPQEIAREKKITDLGKVSQMASNFFHNCLTQTRFGEPGKKYYSSRNFTPEVIEEFKLGFAPAAWNMLSSAFLKRGVKQELLLESGLSKEQERGGGLYDRFRNRIIIPIADEHGKIVGFGGRVIDNSQPKYLNSPETVIFNKRKLLFGLNKASKAIRSEGCAIVVEGYMDAISLHSAGIHNVVASLGTAFTQEQCKLLLRYAKDICFCYDSDAAGQNATVRAMSVVGSTGARTRVIRIPDGKDPDEFLKSHTADDFRKLVAEALPVAEYYIRHVMETTNHTTLEGKSDVLSAVAPVLADMGNVVEQAGYISMLASMLGIDEGMIRAQVNHSSGAGFSDSRAVRPAIRRASAQADDAVSKAGRAMIRLLWNDTGMLEHLLAFIPVEGFSSPAHREILMYLKNNFQNGSSWDAVIASGALSEEAAAELSRAFVEEVSDREPEEIYEDCLTILRRDYLSRLYEQHRLLADKLERQGDADFLKELSESQRIKKEMDEL